MRKLFHNLFWKFMFLLMGFNTSHIGMGGGDGGDSPQAPEFQLPGFAQGLPEEQLAIIRAQTGREVGIPQELDVASQALQGLLGTQAEKFQFPTEAIQEALSAQEAQQLQRFEQKINPLLAQRGQLDSTTRENQLRDFLGQQSTARLGTTADLLTQEALQNLQLQQFVPQFQAGVAGQLGGLGGQRAGIEQFNLQLPFQQASALGGVFGQGLGLGDRTTAQANLQFQADREDFLRAQQQQSQLFQGLGQAGLAAATGGLSGLATGGAGFFGGALQGLQGTAGTAQLLTQFPQLAGTTGTGQFQFRPGQRQPQTLGFG